MNSILSVNGVVLLTLIMRDLREPSEVCVILLSVTVVRECPLMQNTWLLGKFC